MDNAEHKNCSNKTDDQRFALWVSIFIAVLFVIQIFGWLSGHGHWDDLLIFVVLLVVHLTEYFQLKRFAKVLSRVVAWGLAGLILVMLIVRW